VQVRVADVAEDYVAAWEICFATFAVDGHHFAAAIDRDGEVRAHFQAAVAADCVVYQFGEGRGGIGGSARGRRGPEPNQEPSKRASACSRRSSGSSLSCSMSNAAFAFAGNAVGLQQLQGRGVEVLEHAESRDVAPEIDGIERGFVTGEERLRQ